MKKNHLLDDFKDKEVEAWYEWSAESKYVDSTRAYVFFKDGTYFEAKMGDGKSEAIEKGKYNFDLTTLNKERVVSQGFEYLWEILFYA